MPETVTYACDRCGRSFVHEPLGLGPRTYCCDGCREATGCRCPINGHDSVNPVDETVNLTAEPLADFDQAVRLGDALYGLPGVTHLTLNTFEDERAAFSLSALSVEDVQVGLQRLAEFPVFRCRQEGNRITVELAAARHEEAPSPPAAMAGVPEEQPARVPVEELAAREPQPAAFHAGASEPTTPKLAPQTEAATTVVTPAAGVSPTELEPFLRRLDEQTGKLAAVVDTLNRVAEELSRHVQMAGEGRPPEAEAAPLAGAELAVPFGREEMPPAIREEPGRESRLPTAEWAPRTEQATAPPPWRSSVEVEALSTAMGRRIAPRHVTLVASGFPNFTSVNSFIAGVREMPGVRDIKVQELDHGSLRLSLEYYGVSSLAEELGQLPGFRFTVVRSTEEEVHLHFLGGDG